MKVVLDTNCLLVSLPDHSYYRCIWDSFRQGKYTLCYSSEILNEYEELLVRFYSPEFAFLTVEMLLKSQNIIQSIPYYKWNLIFSDPDDNKFVDCALNSGADCIVTNDKHFNLLKNLYFPKIQVFDIDTFREILQC